MNCELHNALLQVKSDVLTRKPDFPYEFGICFAVSMNDPSVKLELTLFLRHVLPKWSEWSGEFSYPVPSTNVYMSALEAFQQYDDLWVGEYGEARMRLLDFLIEESE